MFAKLFKCIVNDDIPFILLQKISHIFLSFGGIIVKSWIFIRKSNLYRHILTKFQPESAEKGLSWKKKNKACVIYNAFNEKNWNILLNF